MKFAITMLVAAAAVAAKGKSKDKRSKPFWPQSDGYGHTITRVWWECNFRGDQDAYCTLDELWAWWEEECYDAIEHQFKHDKFCDYDTCATGDFGTRSDVLSDFVIGSTFDWAVDLDASVTDAESLGYALCDYMYDQLAATVTDEANVNLQELDDWYNADNSPQYWVDESLEWKPVDFTYDNMVSWAGYVYYEWAEAQEAPVL